MQVCKKQPSFSVLSSKSPNANPPVKESASSLRLKEQPNISSSVALAQRKGYIQKHRNTVAKKIETAIINTRQKLLGKATVQESKLPDVFKQSTAFHNI